MEYKGIDYGLGKYNIDTQKMIRYGVISQGDIMDAWCELAEPHYHEAPTEEEMEFAEPDCWCYEDEGYVAHSDDYGDVFIIESPYYTYAQFCSPCAPGACHLNNPISEKDPNNKCYCFGHEWFENEKAPYPVYSVETDELVETAEDFE